MLCVCVCVCVLYMHTHTHTHTHTQPHPPKHIAPGSWSHPTAVGQLAFPRSSWQGSKYQSSPCTFHPGMTLAPCTAEFPPNCSSSETDKKKRNVSCTRESAHATGRARANSPQCVQRKFYANYAHLFFFCNFFSFVSASERNRREKIGERRGRGERSVCVCEREREREGELEKVKEDRARPG